MRSLNKTEKTIERVLATLALLFVGYVIFNSLNL